MCVCVYTCVYIYMYTNKYYIILIICRHPNVILFQMVIFKKIIYISNFNTISKNVYLLNKWQF